MVILFCSGLDPDGNPAEATFGQPTLEGGLDTLSFMVERGWKLCRIDLIQGAKPPVPLPVEAFDGSAFSQPIKSLQDQWQRALA